MQLLRLALLTLTAASLAIAAGIDGKWTGDVATQNGPVKLTLSLKAQGETFTGTASAHTGDMAIKDGKIKGDELTWHTMHERDGDSLKILNKAKVSGNEMQVVTTVEGREEILLKYTLKKAD